jgi:hypothetical protein
MISKAQLFREFLKSGDTLRVYRDNKLLFTSRKERLLPLLEYIDNFTPDKRQVLVFDRVMGNAAALLCAKAACKETYSPLGSQLAVETLDEYGIKYHFVRVVPYIHRPHSEEMCPMEKLSIDKEPGEFYQAIKEQIAR